MSDDALRIVASNTGIPLQALRKDAESRAHKFKYWVYHNRWMIVGIVTTAVALGVGAGVGVLIYKKKHQRHSSSS